METLPSFQALLDSTNSLPDVLGTAVSSSSSSSSTATMPSCSSNSAPAVGHYPLTDIGSSSFFSSSFFSSSSSFFSSSGELSSLLSTTLTSSRRGGESPVASPFPPSSSSTTSSSSSSSAHFTLSQATPSYIPSTPFYSPLSPGTLTPLISTTSSIPTPSVPSLPQPISSDNIPQMACGGVTYAHRLALMPGTTSPPPTLIAPTAMPIFPATDFSSIPPSSLSSSLSTSPPASSSSHSPSPFGWTPTGTAMASVSAPNIATGAAGSLAPSRTTILKQKAGQPGNVGKPPVPPGVRVCTMCGTTKTKQWRSGSDGKPSLCNACGLRYRKDSLGQKFKFKQVVIFPSGSKKRKPLVSPTDKNKQDSVEERDITASLTAASSPASSPKRRRHSLPEDQPTSPLSGEGSPKASDIYSLLN